MLVRVAAAAITFTELGWDQSWTTRDGHDRTPVIPSHELSGTVAALGGGVTTPAVGDEVYGLIDFDRDGAAAQFATVPAEHVARKPATASHAEAARQLIGRVAMLELVRTVLARALEPFPIPVRTLDALHLASVEFLRTRGHQVALATYDDRLATAAKRLRIPLASI